VRRFRYGVYSLWLVLSLVASLVVPSGIASAVGGYDDAVSLTDSASVTSPDGFVVRDISSSWLSLIGLESTPGCVAVYEEISNLDYNGGAMLGVSTFRNDGMQRGVYVYWTSAGGQLGFHASGLHHGLVGGANANITPGSSGGGDVGSVYFLVDNASNLTVNCFHTAFSLSGNEISDNSVHGSKVYFTSWPVNYPADYEGELVPATPPNATYVAMGDSIASGEGNPTFEPGTDVSNQNGCHRSFQAYPRLLQSRLELGPVAFVACSGATTANILGGQWNEPSQLDALSEEAELVTLHIGANDVDFTDYAFGCALACGPGSGPYNMIMSKISNPDFKDDLVETYEAILGVNDDLKLYVADYPHLSEEGATTCQGLDFSGAYYVQEALNEVIFDAVIEVGLNSSRIYMVQTNYPGSPFEGGHLCNGGDSLFHGLVSPPNLEYSLHPDQGGHEAFAEVFEEAIA
jgi:hypothetical protein